MAASLISNIYDDFKSIYEDDPQFIIDFFGNNILLFNNIKSFDDIEDLQSYIELSMFYTHALFQKNRYNETIDAVDKVLPIINDETIKLKAFELKDKYYTILFLKGQASYRLKDYKSATSIFKELTFYDSKDENYIDWLRHSLHGKRQWIITVLSIIGTIFIVIGFVIRFYTKDYNLRQLFPIIGLVILLGIYIYDLYTKRSFRKLKASGKAH